MMSPESQAIDPKYWNNEQSRWQTHEAFNTTHHEHINHYGDKTSCDLMIVKCSDGRWYIEDTWGKEAPGHHDVLDVHDREARVIFMDESTARERAQQVVNEICQLDGTT